ncbi:MAG: ABC transporter ATP-binding protein [Planctomycetota bacterium]
MEHRTLWDLTRGQRLRYAGAILVMWVGFVFLSAVPQISGATIDGILGDEDPGERWLLGHAARLEADLGTLTSLCVVAAAVVLVSGAAAFFQYLRGRWASQASEAIVRQVRNHLYKHLERLPCRYHDEADTGDLVQRCSSDVETIRVFLSGQIVEIGRAVLLLATVLPILIVKDARLTLVATMLVPPIILFATAFFRKVKNLFKETDEAEGRMTAVLQENLTGIRVVRAFARQDFECGKFAASNSEHRDLHYRLIRLLGIYWATSDFLCMSQIGLVLVCGASWGVTPGTLFEFVSFVYLFIWPVRQLGRVLTDTGKAVIALGRVRAILAEEPESDLAHAEVPAALRGEIEIDGLTFAYDGRAPALRDVALRVGPGETLALLGPPGCGKTTVVHLLLRLYDYERGSIRLDGRELSGLPRSFVRSQIGVVLQEPFLFSKTLAGNVRFAREDATEEEMVASAEAACIHASVEEFEDGYETLVGERGVTLSGGQRQRVAIARALLKDAPILVLDDSLSAVDTHTETRILEALRERRGKRTTILIAHRLSSIRNADRILVLEGGSRAQYGTHDELLREEGPYRRLWRIQGALEDELTEDLSSAPGGGRP